MSAHPSAEQLSAFLDQELPDAVRLSLEEHLRTCDACASHLAELAAVDEAARALPVEEPAGYFDDFAARVRARVDTRTPRRTLPVWSWAAAAALLLAVVTPLAWRERAAQAPAATAVREEAPAPSAGFVPPPAAKPQAPPAGAGRTTAGADRSLLESRGRRANEAELSERLERRDQAADSAPEVQAQVSQDKREQAPAAAEPVPATAAPSRLEEKTTENLKALGYVAPPPPATSQRQHGPRSQQRYAPPPPPPPAPAAPPAAADEVAAAAAPVTEGTADGLRDADLAKEKDDDRSARAKRSGASEAGGGAGGRLAADPNKLGATGSIMKSVPARTGAEARRRREVFRRMALERPDDASADDARVGTIEEGVRAYRLEGRAEDRAMAERDGRAYLARPGALQATRVRALLEELEATR